MKSVAKGIVRKMATRLEQPVAYQVRLGDERVPLNPLLNKKLRLNYTGTIYCVLCGRKTNKSFNQGYCYPCFQKAPECDPCIIHPEKCHPEYGTERDPAWGEKYLMQDHIVYLANSSGLKVGITRATQVPTRWIDQGATQALAMIRVRNRYHSGLLEVMFKQHVKDKTNWRDMLKGDAEPLDMEAERDKLLEECKKEIEELDAQFGFYGVSLINGVDTVAISYPVTTYPEKINSFNFDKEPVVEGKLQGVKGQYLIFDEGVINLRRFSGYEVELSH